MHEINLCLNVHAKTIFEKKYKNVPGCIKTPHVFCFLFKLGLWVYPQHLV